MSKKRFVMAKLSQLFKTVITRDLIIRSDLDFYI